MHAGEHGVAAGLEIGRLGQVDEQFQRLPGDPVLAVVDVEITDGQRQLAATCGILVEQLAEVFRTDLIVMSDQCVPRRCSGDVGNRNGTRRTYSDPSAATVSKE